ncbi:MAG TPA: SPFH domain-containing protein [Phycisphaerae bacterium]|nr:SPFH domain-containing protein [Phycisphaerae bacterium]
MFSSALIYGLLIFVAVVLLAGIRYIPNKRLGIVEKRWSRRGSVPSGLIALRGEAGFQPNVLRGGLHFLMPLQYKVHIMPLVTIAQGKIGYVFARDGQPLSPTQTLASNERATNFEDVGAFLRDGGQRGPQRQVLREGTYAINLAQFVVITADEVYFLPIARDDQTIFDNMTSLIADRHGFEPVVIKGTDDSIGIVTVHDGPSLANGEIIAPVVGVEPGQPEQFHNNFQDPERFLCAGGRRGRQLQVLVDGTYYLNRLFATVEMIPKTVVDVGSVGVVVSYTGETGADLSGVDYKHGELVKKGQRGVWSEALLPGKYAFNTYAGKVIAVPTTNFILKWIRNEAGTHKYDENLREVSLITKDAFEPTLPLSVVVHIDYRKAPLVIQRFGDVKKLVEQTLDPMVSAYFKNIGQTRTLIQLLQDRAMIQKLASEEMQEKFAHYNLELEEVLIGTPGSANGDQRIESILTQLRTRQIAEEQIETYSRQEKAAVKERELREAEARARQQQSLTESELSITIQANQGKADYQRSLQQAAQIRALAEAEAEKSARIGIAQAIAIEEQVRAYGGPQFQLTQQVMSRFAEAIQQSGVDVVPRMVVGASQNGHGGSGSVMEGLLSMLLAEKMGTVSAITNDSPRNAEADRLRSQIRESIAAKPRA